MITVHNCLDGRPSGRVEYIGRPRTLGNPFVIGEDGDRRQVILKYKEWLWAHLKSRQGPVYAKLLALSRAAAQGDLKLLCHCRPKPCHGDVVKAALEWMLDPFTDHPSISPRTVIHLPDNPLLTTDSLPAPSPHPEPPPAE